MEKERNYMFDSFRGILIWCIPISHFIRVAGHFSSDSLSGIVYITINVFVMQAFMFLSGYFSKNPGRARASAFKTFMLPYLVFTFVFYIFRYCYFGHANLHFLTPPFALWFLFSVFFYRYFLVNLIKIKHLLILSFVLCIFAGMIPGCSNFLALQRMLSYFPFFVLGYYCSKQRLESVQVLKWWQSFILSVVLLGISIFLAFYIKFPVDFYLLRGTATEAGMVWYMDIFMRIVIQILALAWIILLLNIIPNKSTYLTYVGINTMPIYIFHLFIRYIIKVNGLPCPNWFVYYSCIFGLASLCIVVFSSTPITKLYDKTLEFCYEIWVKFKKLVLF